MFLIPMPFKELQDSGTLPKRIFKVSRNSLKETQMKINSKLTLQTGLSWLMQAALGSLTLLRGGRAVKIASLSKAETSIAASSQKQDKYSFILFWKRNDSATQAMWQTLQNGLTDRTDQAVGLAVKVLDPAEAAIVKQFGVSRTDAVDARRCSQRCGHCLVC